MAENMNIVTNSNSLMIFNKFLSPLFSPTNSSFSITILIGLILVIFLIFYFIPIINRSLLFLSSQSSSSPSIKITKLFIYPIHGCHGIEMTSAHLTTSNGLQYDQQFALMNSLNELITLKSQPKLVTIVPSFSSTLSPPSSSPSSSHEENQPIKLILSAPNVLSIEVPLESDEKILNPPPQQRQRLRLRLNNNDIIDVYEIDPDISRWFSKVLNVPNIKFVKVTDVYFKKDATEKSLTTSTKPSAPARPLSLNNQRVTMISEESLIDFHSRISSTSTSSSPSSPSSLEITMKRFRPNIVIQGSGQAYSEDLWEGIVTSNGQQLTVLRSCEHASLPNIHPLSGVMETSLKITRVLKSYRTGGKLGMRSEVEQKIFMGVELEFQKSEVAQTGVLSVGDKLEITY